MKVLVYTPSLLNGCVHASVKSRLLDLLSRSDTFLVQPHHIGQHVSSYYYYIPSISVPLTCTNGHRGVYASSTFACAGSLAVK